MRALHVIAALLFVTMTVIQLNDPYPLYWVVVYSAVALVAVLRCVGIRAASFSKIVIGMTVAGILIAAPGTVDYFVEGDYDSIYGQMSAEKPYIESAREFGGLFAAFIYLVIAECFGRGKRDR